MPTRPCTPPVPPTCRAIALVWLMLWAPPPALGAAPRLPEGFVAVFDVEVLGQTVGEVRWTLSQEPDRQRYLLDSTTRAQGPWGVLLPGERRERSLWERDPEGRPRPLQYRSERTGAKPRAARIDFDWQAGVATSTYRDRVQALPIAPGTLDPVVYVLALMQDLAAGRAELAFTFAERGKVKTYALTREGTETVQTGAGALRAERLARVDEEGRRTTLWCAPARAYLPVRIEHDEPGSPKLVLTLRESRGLGPTP